MQTMKSFLLVLLIFTLGCKKNVESDSLASRKAKHKTDLWVIDSFVSIQGKVSEPWKQIIVRDTSASRKIGIKGLYPDEDFFEIAPPYYSIYRRGPYYTIQSSSGLGPPHYNFVMEVRALSIPDTFKILPE